MPSVTQDVIDQKRINTFFFFLKRVMQLTLCEVVRA